jgi:hypothetical protein
MPEITSTSISDVWLSAVTLTSAAPNHEVLNLDVTVIGLEQGGPAEDAAVRSSLDQMLADSDMGSVQTVASTIFPNSMWNPNRPKEQLFSRYMSAFPKIRKCRSNSRGTYFQRLINYPSFKAPGFNQLKHVIETYLGGNHRRSALQASLIVPEADLNNAPLQGFPCMQQIAFIPKPKTSTLHVVGFYPHQYLFQRAYGNYLGLIQLGRFVAHEMHLTLATMTCVSTIADLEVSAKKIKPILSLKT